MTRPGSAHRGRWRRPDTGTLMSSCARINAMAFAAAISRTIIEKQTLPECKPVLFRHSREDIQDYCLHSFNFVRIQRFYKAWQPCWLCTYHPKLIKFHRCRHEHGHFFVIVPVSVCVWRFRCHSPMIVLFGVCTFLHSRGLLSVFNLGHPVWDAFKNIALAQYY